MSSRNEKAPTWIGALKEEKGTDLFLLRCAENFHRMDLLGSTDSGLENKSVPFLVTTF